jgi:hypothetical protein
VAHRLLVLAVLPALVAAAPAGASHGQRSLIQDDHLLLQSRPAVQARALDDVVALGAEGVRAVVLWDAIAPRRRPSGFDGADPGAYAAGRWNPLDDLVRGTSARRLALLLSASVPGPRWASGCPAGTAMRKVCRPDPQAYGAFLRAIGRRYSGTYRDENQGGGVLPRVTRWSFSNEPNQPAWLRPQFGRRDGIRFPVAAVLYRGLVREALAGLRGSGHGGDELLLGETGPIGRETGRLNTRPVAPGTFLRTLLCLDADGDPLATGAAARVRRCGRSFKPLAVTGFAHHPYTRGGSQPPTARGPAATEITISSAGRLKRLLDAAGRAERIPEELPVHYTEYGFQTSPPDFLFGVPLARQAEYLNRSDWIAWRDRRIRTVAQYKLDDDPVVSSFQSGLRFWDGVPKPSYDAYRLALWVSRRGDSRLRVYGQLRPLAPGARAAVELQNAPLGRGAFRTVETFTVRSRNGTFLRTIDRREGRFRLQWGTLRSREAIAPR